jgi:hypothetical protein
MLSANSAKPAQRLQHALPLSSSWRGLIAANDESSDCDDRQCRGSLREPFLIAERRITDYQRYCCGSLCEPFLIAERSPTINAIVAVRSATVSDRGAITDYQRYFRGSKYDVAQSL